MRLRNQSQVPVGKLVTSEGLQEVINSTNFPGLVLLGLAGIPTLILLVRWMIRFQREFTDIYIQENQKLRDRVQGLEDEIQQKDETIIELRTQIGKLQNQLDDHTRTIAHLNKVIERRQLD